MLIEVFCKIVYKGRLKHNHKLKRLVYQFSLCKGMTEKYHEQNTDVGKRSVKQ